MPLFTNEENEARQLNVCLCNLFKNSNPNIGNLQNGHQHQEAHGKEASGYSPIKLHLVPLMINNNNTVKGHETIESISLAS